MGNDPSCLAGADESDLLRVDIGTGSHAFAGEVDDHLSMGAFVDWLIEGDRRRRALRSGRVVEGLTAPAQGEHDSRQQEA